MRMEADVSKNSQIFFLILWFITLASLLASIVLMRDMGAKSSVPKPAQHATPSGFTVPPPPF